MPPIAHIETPFKTKFGVPRQAGLVDFTARIVFEPDYRVPEAVRGLEDFDYLWLIWHFHKISSPLPGSIGDMACDRSGAKLGEVAAQRADGGVCIHGDAAHMALEMWRQAQPDPYAYCQRASHVHRLEGFGPQAQADIAFAFKMNTCPLVPVLKKGVLTL